MRFGCCIAGPQPLAVARTAALDYVEVSVAGWVMAGDADAFEGLRGALMDGPPPHAANVFLPPALRLVGPGFERDRVFAYVREAVRRLRLLGVRLLVLGSGGPRRIPDGYDRERGLEELAAFCRQTAGIAAAAGITLVLEPLRRAESNVWNTVGEVAAFIRHYQLEGVRLLADLYHMREEAEPVTAVSEHADLLAHTHVAGPGRVPPRPEEDLSAFLARARQARNDITCSIECRWTDFAAELGPAVRALRGCAR